eukprot:Blabericola_migrator_1__7514@NODE_383_length_9140_cov_403_746611_g306_i0_p3_GENE_NODE_383_length_9140_cov_403_746611_g306_i0NODE_383_length_9140_cov_403_746611_g306_i0_p3_ORF_typecomplete_len524_score118_21zfCHY/PF05495_12/2_1e03zfCHY/PF05495_12/1e03zfCHY/PF05495_12/1e02zfCHY/PF05495_12/7_9e15Myb_DNAbinding/PF00249_31/6_7e08Myb_DNAbinding/PF00249_31/4_5e03Myb_DNAbind_6/PF13921_6/6_7e06Astro_capsid_p/PF12226_8/0_023_NODE_383_length_9140_cov_403_746611_g306_i012032774
MMPSDPDVETAFQSGIHMRLRISEAYRQDPYSVEDPGVSVDIVNEGLSSFFRTGVSSRFVSHLKDTLSVRNHRPIYEALKRLDRDIPELYAEAQREAVKRVWPEGPWTEHEQVRLEAALVYYGKVADPIVKWTQIADYVGTRSRKQCAARFKECQQIARDQELEKEKQRLQEVAAKLGSCPDVGDVCVSTNIRDALEDDVSSESEDREGSESTDESVGDESVVKDTSEVERPVMGQTLTFSGLELEGIGVVSLQKLKIQVSCGRCGKKSDVVLPVAKPGQAYTHSEFIECSNCHCGIRCSAHGHFTHSRGGDPIATVVVKGGRVSDVLPSDYLASCLHCSTDIKYGEIYSAMKRTTVCRFCHIKTSLYFTHVQIAGTQEAVTGLPLPAPPKKKKEKDPFVLTVGQPLPKNGACTHYKKSFRWFRFPCCGMAYPCDKCHDAVSTHKAAEMATRIICGLCSREQPANNDSCTCGSQMTAAKSRHWEGGKGCRDPTVMSRRDDKKYKLLHRQQMALSKAKAKAKSK